MGIWLCGVRLPLQLTAIQITDNETRAFGLTCYTSGINDVVKEFGVSMTEAILGLSLYLFGIAFAPIWTPHAAERLGRSKIYLASLFVCSLFILGAGLSPNFTGVAICRFFAGLTGGPCLVLIEGTFADIWSADTTNTYYAVLGLSSYCGAAAGKSCSSGSAKLMN